MAESERNLQDYVTVEKEIWEWRAHFFLELSTVPAKIERESRDLRDHWEVKRDGKKGKTKGSHSYGGNFDIDKGVRRENKRTTTIERRVIMTQVSLPTVHTLMPFAPFSCLEVTWGDWSWLNFLSVLVRCLPFCVFSLFSFSCQCIIQRTLFLFLPPFLSLLVSFTLHIEKETHIPSGGKRDMTNLKKPARKTTKNLPFFPFSVCSLYSALCILYSVVCSLCSLCNSVIHTEPTVFPITSILLHLDSPFYLSLSIVVVLDFLFLSPLSSFLSFLLYAMVIPCHAMPSYFTFASSSFSLSFLSGLVSLWVKGMNLTENNIRHTKRVAPPFIYISWSLRSVTLLIFEEECWG